MIQFYNIIGKPAQLYETTNPDWVPTLHMGHKVTVPDQERHKRAEERAKRKRVVSEVYTSTKSKVAAVAIEAPIQTIGCQTEPAFMLEYMQLQTDNDRLRKENDKLIKQNDELRMKVAYLERTRVSSENLQRSDHILKFYTGNTFCHKFIMISVYTGIAEWCVFKALFDLVSSAIPDNTRLSKMSIFIMFFMKLRLNLMDEDLAFRFGVHCSTISRYFHQVLDVMAVKTAPFIKWPERDTLRETMPTAFRKFFKKCAVIIDCTEIFIERPSDLLARAQVWSNYKHHSTIKFLIGITPQGTISHISKCVGGRMSDKEITEQSGLIQHLLPG